MRVLFYSLISACVLHAVVLPLRGNRAGIAVLGKPVAHHVEHRGLVAVVIGGVAIAVVGRMDNHLLRNCESGDDRANGLRGGVD